MEAEDLMIGDWVYNHRYWECPIVEIHKNSAIVIARHYGEEEFLLSELRPIPLTTDILEKNGFVYDSEDKLFEDIYPRISMLYAQYRLVENGGINYGEMSEIKYVHQLQHALRLCGIDKEIELCI